MNQDDNQYLPFDQAVKIVGAIQEEEHTHEPDRRIFTVYALNNQELCWFDAAETIAKVLPDAVNPKKDVVQPKVEEYILNHIPTWVLD